MAGSPEKSGRSTSGRRRFPIWLAAAIAIALAGLAAAVYFAARAGERPLPEMPRARFEPAQVDAALAALRARAAGFTVRDDELRLIGELRAVHAAEGAARRGVEPPDRAAALTDAYRKSAAALASRDRDRFLRLGEKLALDLQDAIGPLLAAARRDGLPAVLAGTGPELRRAVETGGGFVFYAADRGLVDAAGELHGARLLPEVLFRMRWCAAVGLDELEGLAPIERRAALDFRAAFTQDAAARLSAIDALATLDPAYDRAVARALALHAAGRVAEARAAIEEAAAAGRDDRPIELLRDALD